MHFSAGDKLGPYEILAPIGAGGMGDVYKARDTRLDRIVAVKVSKEQFSERFEREARTVAALNHPNICTLYDVGLNYLVMEYVEGEPLKGASVDGWRHAVRSADRGRGSGRALQGHRSSRSETGEHFRHARRPREDPRFRSCHVTSRHGAYGRHGTLGLTDPGTAVGTIGYMSPEQARGETVDARSDLWAMGVIFYELLTGVRPFDGSTQAVIFEGILSKTPVPPSSRNPKIPAEWERIVTRLLEKDRATRYQSAQDLLADLKRVNRDSSSVGTSPPPAAPGRGWRKYALAAGAGLILLAAVAYFLTAPDRLDRFSRHTSFRQRQSQRRCGLPERWHHRQPHRQSVQLAGLKGEVEKCCPQIQGRRHRCGSSRPGTGCGRRTDGPDRAAWRFAFHSRRPDRHSRQQRDLGREFRTQNFGDSQRPAGYYGPHFGKLRLSGEDKRQLARRETANPEAYQLYLKGLYFTSRFTKDGVDKGLDYFRQAIAADPNYALAYQGLADNYSIQDDVFAPSRDTEPKAKAAALKALELDDHLAEAHEALGEVLFWYEYDWPGAEKEFRRAIELNENLAGAHTIYGWYLTCLGQPEKGIAEGARRKHWIRSRPNHCMS